MEGGQAPRSCSLLISEVTLRSQFAWNLPGMSHELCKVSKRQKSYQAQETLRNHTPKRSSNCEIIINDNLNQI